MPPARSDEPGRSFLSTFLSTFLAVLAASLAGAVGMAILDVVLAMGRANEPTPMGALLRSLHAAIGLYGLVALLVGVGAGVLVASVGALLPAAGVGALRTRLSEEVELDRGAAAGILAVGAAAAVIVSGVFVFALLFGLEMANKRNGALSTALVAAAMVVPAALAWFPAFLVLRPLVSLLPRPRALWALGMCGAVALLGVAAAIFSVDWRVIDFGPFFALLGFVVLGAGHYLVWHRGPGAGLFARLPAAASLLAPVVAAALVGLLLLTTLSGFGGEPRSLALVGEETWGARPILRALRKVADRDKDGYAAILGGGDCDDHDAHRFPGATDEPGNQIDEDCDGSDAVPVAEETPAAAPRTPTPAPTRDTPRPPATIDEKAPPPTIAGAKGSGNLLIITIDTLRADRLGDKVMPHLAAFAKGATVFTRAYAQAPNTPRSFPSFLTSRYPSRVAWERPFANFSPITAENLTFFEVLQQAGVHTAAEFSHFYAEPKTGIQQGFDEWHNDGALTLHDSNTDISAPRITTRVVKRLGELAKSKQRFALWTHLFDPHSRYMEHPGIATSGTGFKLLESKYDGEVSFVDQHLQQIFDALKSAGLDESTTVVLFADHGEAFGEHRFGGQLMFFHGETVYDEQLRVPLVVRVPGQPGRVVEEREQLIDVGPTVVELAGAPVPPSFQGRSLLPALHGEVLPARPVYAELLPAPSWNHSWRVLVDGDYKLINKISENTIELYDVAHDPSEQKNLALAQAADVARLKELLQRYPGSAATPGATGAKTPAAPSPAAAPTEAK